jgi:hypothetical protein
MAATVEEERCIATTAQLESARRHQLERKRCGGRSGQTAAAKAARRASSTEIAGTKV